MGSSAVSTTLGLSRLGVGAVYSLAWAKYNDKLDITALPTLTATASRGTAYHTYCPPRGTPTAEQLAATAGVCGALRAADTVLNAKEKSLGW